MSTVFVLHHSYELGDDCGEHEEVKLIGVYSSEEKAHSAAERLHQADGFKDLPFDCFFIDAFQLDEDHWTSGFFTYRYSV